MPKTLLIVDDEAMIRKFFAKAFQKDGNTVLPAGTGKEALRILRREKPALMFLDIILPDIDGLDVLRSSLEIHPDLPIIAITGRRDDEVGRRCLEAGAKDFVTKPIDLDYLQTTALAYLL